MAIRKSRSKSKSDSKATTRKRPASSRKQPQPKTHPSVKAAQEIGLDVSPAERAFLESSQNVPSEGNPLQGRTF